MAASLLLQPRLLLPPKPSPPTDSLHGSQTLTMSLKPKPFSPCLSLSSTSRFAIRAAASTPAPSSAAPPRLADSTRTVTSLIPVAVSVSLSIAKLLHRLPLPSPQDLAALRSVAGGFGRAVVLACFTALRDRPGGYLNNPLTVVASGLSK